MDIDLEKIIKDSDKTIERLPVKDFSERAYLNYSMYVILVIHFNICTKKNRASICKDIYAI